MKCLCAILLFLVTTLAPFSLATSTTEPNDEKEAAVRIVGPGTCAGCHIQEAEKWKSTRHQSGFRTLNRVGSSETDP